MDDGESKNHLLRLLSFSFRYKKAPFNSRVSILHAELEGAVY